MKRILLIIMLVVPVWAMAEGPSPIDKLFNKYANKDGFTTVNISGKLLGLASMLGDSSDSDAAVMQKLSAIRILTVDDEELNKKLDFYEELEADGFFKNHDYEVLMEVTQKDEVVRFFGRSGEKNKLSELLLIVGGDGNSLISIRGIIDPDDIGKITNSLDIDIQP